MYSAIAEELNYGPIMSYEDVAMVDDDSGDEELHQRAHLQPRGRRGRGGEGDCLAYRQFELEANSATFAIAYLNLSILEVRTLNIFSKGHSDLFA